eukprot:scaffold14658_cov67-Phaeocystis_antarctica.AAC.9
MVPPVRAALFSGKPASQAVPNGVLRCAAEAVLGSTECVHPCGVPCPVAQHAGEHRVVLEQRGAAQREAGHRDASAVGRRRVGVAGVGREDLHPRVPPGERRDAVAARLVPDDHPAHASEPQPRRDHSVARVRTHAAEGGGGDGARLLLERRRALLRCRGGGDRATIAVAGHQLLTAPPAPRRVPIRARRVVGQPVTEQRVEPVAPLVDRVHGAARLRAGGQAEARPLAGHEAHRARVDAAVDEEGVPQQHGHVRMLHVSAQQPARQDVAHRRLDHLLVARCLRVSRGPPGQQRHLASAELEGLGTAQRVQVHVAQPLRARVGVACRCQMIGERRCSRVPVWPWDGAGISRHLGLAELGRQAQLVQVAVADKQPHAARRAALQRDEPLQQPAAAVASVDRVASVHEVGVRVGELELARRIVPQDFALRDPAVKVSQVAFDICEVTHLDDARVAVLRRRNRQHLGCGGRQPGT